MVFQSIATPSEGLEYLSDRKGRFNRSAGPRILLTRLSFEYLDPTTSRSCGPVKWTYYYLYVILDIFSRYVTGWMLARRESAELARRLISESGLKQNIDADQLTMYADRGSSMRSKSVALLLADLGITKTHSRPYVSNDNPYSESQFKTMKYCPEFPSRFGCLEKTVACSAAISATTTTTTRTGTRDWAS